MKNKNNIIALLTFSKRTSLHRERYLFGDKEEEQASRCFSKFTFKQEEASLDILLALCLSAGPHMTNDTRMEGSKDQTSKISRQ